VLSLRLNLPVGGEFTYACTSYPTFGGGFFARVDSHLMSLATRNLEPIVVLFCTVGTLSALLTRTAQCNTGIIGQSPINKCLRADGHLKTASPAGAISNINGSGKPRGGWCKRVLFHPPEVSSLGKVADAR